MSITVGNIKGGTGKSTTVVFLALLLHSLTGGRVLLIDADKNSQTVSDWSAQAPDWPEAVVVAGLAVTDLGRKVQAIRGDYDHVVIDTGGHSEEILGQALMVTDELIVPVAPSPLEIRRLPATFQVATRVDVISPIAAQVLLVRVGAGDSDLDASEARALFEQEGVPYMDSYTRQLKGYPRAFGQVPDDFMDYLDVLDELTAPEASA
ncbi:MAG: AAA family ATPase [Mycobacteriales bacterium]